VTPEDSGVPFRVRNFPPTGRDHSGRLGLKHETILSERIETARRRKNVFEKRTHRPNPKRRLSRFEMSSSKSGSCPVEFKDRPGAQVKLNDSSSGDGVGRCLTTLWSAGSLSAKSLAPDSREASPKLYWYRHYGATQQTPVEQIDTLTSGAIYDVRWVMGLSGNAMNRFCREHTRSAWAAAKWVMP
jgi:hypothetical protein